MFDMVRHCKAVGRRARHTFNLTPKSRKGTEEMKETEKLNAEMQEKIEEFMNAYQRKLINGVLELLEAKSEMYQKILHNGYDIWMQSTGDRWVKIQQQRDKIWIKRHLIANVETEIIEKYY